MIILNLGSTMETIGKIFFVNLLLVNNTVFIFSVKNGVFRQYRGTRDKDEFISFVEGII